MNKIVDRAKNILFHPKEEWAIIQHEYTPTKELLLQYVLPLAAIASVATFLGYWIFGLGFGPFKVGGFSTGLVFGINSLIIHIATIVIVAAIIDALAPSFDAEKNLEKSMQLMAYAYTPVLIGSFLNIFPGISLLGTLLGLYCIPLLYWGLPLLKQVPENKRVVYLILIVVALIVVNWVLGFVLNTLFGSPYHIPG